MRFKLFILTIIGQLIFSFNCFADEIQFESPNIKVLENGKIINAFYGKAYIPSDQIEIEGDEFFYDKELQRLTVIKNVKFLDIRKEVYLEGEKVIYDKVTNIVYSVGKTYLKIVL